MKTRRAGKAEAETQEARPAGVRKGGVRKKAGAVVTKRVVLRGRTTSSLRTAASRPPQPSAAEQNDGPGPPNAAAQELADVADELGGDQQQEQEQPRQVRRQALAKLKRHSTGSESLQKPTIEALNTETLQEIFLYISKQDEGQQSYCREILPLVCKRFREVLLKPSPLWETLHLNFLHKGQDLFYLQLQQYSQNSHIPMDGSNRRMLHSAVERWLKPRAAAVRRLVLSFSARDPSHSFLKNGHGLHRTFQLLGPTLQELCIAHCSDVFHSPSFADLALLKILESLAVTFMTGQVAAADLAALEKLPKLRSLTLSAARQMEEGGEHCLAGFPEALTKLKGLTSLAVCSLGVTALPVGITKLKSLVSLDVSGCPLSFLPSMLWKLSALRHLRLNDTMLMLSLIHTWEPLVKLPALESLELRDTKTERLPPMLTGLTSLTNLDLSDNCLEALEGGGPDAGLRALVNLPKLQRLLLRGCQLPSVPSDVHLLSRLTHLDVSRNQLVELPPSLSSLLALRELVAEGNCFPRIPQVLGQLPVLEVADLSFNIYMEAAVSLQPLLEDGGLTRLRRLDLRKMLGAWKQSSTKWLTALLKELELQRLESGDPMPVVLWD